MTKLEKVKFLNEVAILNELDHPNISKLIEFYEDKSFFHLVTDMWEGGELFDFIIKNKFLSERMTVDIIT